MQYIALQFSFAIQAASHLVDICQCLFMWDAQVPTS
jgi:hypothetical protein